MDHQNCPLLKEKEIADQWVKRLYRPANHMVANGSQLSQQYLKAYCPKRQCGGLAVLVLCYVNILPQLILNMLFEHDLYV